MLSLNHILSLKVHTICFNNVIYCLLVLVFDTYILLFCISLRELVRFYVYLFHGCTEIQNDAYDSHNCQVCQLLQKIFMINQMFLSSFYEIAVWNENKYYIYAQFRPCMQHISLGVAGITVLVLKPFQLTILDTVSTS